MGLNLETLVGMLVILILLIMADGLRRMLRERNTRLRMKIEPRQHREDAEAGGGDRFNPELPSGGARVVQRILEQRAAAEEEAREREQPERPAFRAATQQPLFEADDEP